MAARRSVAKISRQSERADPGVRLTMLYRKAETGKRLMSGPQAIGIFASVPITTLDEIRSWHVM